MRLTIAAYNSVKCRQTLAKLALPGIGSALFIGAVIYFVPAAVEINSARFPIVAAFGVLVTVLLISSGPFLANLLYGALTASDHVWVDDARLFIGKPFTRSVRISDVLNVDVENAAGEIFQKVIRIHLRGGRSLSFIADVSDLDARTLTGELEKLRSA